MMFRHVANDVSVFVSTMRTKAEEKKRFFGRNPDGE